MQSKASISIDMAAADVDPAADTPEEDPLASLGFSDEPPSVAKPALAEPELAPPTEPAPAVPEGEQVEEPSEPTPQPPEPTPEVPEPEPEMAPAPVPVPEPVAAPSSAVTASAIAERIAEPLAGAPSEMVIVDIASPPPGAVKFIGAMSEVGSTVSTLGSDDVSDGFHHLAQRCGANAMEAGATFKSHSLDLAIAATTDHPDDSRHSLRVALSKAEARKLIAGPAAVLYAVLAMICLVAFAVVYYPKQYAPKLYEAAKTKLVEYKVIEKATDAAMVVKAKTAVAFEAAASSEVELG